MKSRLSAGPLACAIILSALTGAAVVEARKDGGPSWEQQTEQKLGVGRGMARQLTSEEEWHRESRPEHGEALAAKVYARGTRSVVPSGNRTTSCRGPSSTSSRTCPASG